MCERKGGDSPRELAGLEDDEGIQSHGAWTSIDDGDGVFAGIEVGDFTNSLLSLARAGC